MAKDKKKKKKTVYVDDGRTVADMSGINGGRSLNNGDLSPRATFKDKARTYFAAVKQMFFPMLATIGAISVAFLILYLILELAA